MYNNSMQQLRFGMERFTTITRPEPRYRMFLDVPDDIFQHASQRLGSGMMAALCRSNKSPFWIDDRHPVQHLTLHPKWVNFGDEETRVQRSHGVVDFFRAVDEIATDSGRDPYLSVSITPSEPAGAQLRSRIRLPEVYGPEVRELTSTVMQQTARDLGMYQGAELKDAVGIKMFHDEDLRLFAGNRSGTALRTVGVEPDVTTNTLELSGLLPTQNEQLVCIVGLASIANAEQLLRPAF